MNKEVYWKNRRFWAGVLAAGATLGLVTGCSGGGDGGGDAAGNTTAGADCEETYTIGFSHPAGEVAAVKAVKKAVEERAAENGCVNLLLDNTVDSNLETQRSAVENWVTQGIDAIVVWPVDVAAMEGLREQAQSNGTKWLTYASPNPEEDGSVGFDNDTAGQELAAELKTWVEENYPDKNIKAAVTTWTPLPSLEGRWQNVLDALDEMGIEVISEQDCLSQDCGVTLAEEAIRKAPDDLKIFVGANDDVGTGALRALNNAGVDMNGFFVAGYDGTEEALTSLKDGTGYTRSAAIPLAELGYSIIDNSIAAITGEGNASNLTPMIVVGPDDTETIDELLELF